MRTHVLLDLDGTLSASGPSITSSLHAALVAEGFAAPPVEALVAYVGPPFEHALPRLGVPPARVWDVIAQYRRIYDAGAIFETTAFDGVEEMLRDLVAAGLTLALATSKPETAARRIVEHFGWLDHFTVIGGASAGAERRSKADVIAHALAELATEPGPHVVMVGDRDYDVHGAHEFGIDCIGVAWGYGSADEFAAAGVDATALSPADVTGLVLGTRPWPAADVSARPDRH